MLDIKINKKILQILFLIYVYVPVCIFLIGFVKPVFSILSIMVILFCTYSFFANVKNSSRNIEEPQIKLNVSTFVFVTLFITILMYMVGYGGYKEQPIDWYKHNGVLMDLIKKSWPVYYVNGDDHSMLSYYVGAYMIPSLIGRICHDSYDVAVMATWVYVEIGVILVYIGIIHFLKIDKWYMQIYGLLIFLFFIGLQDVGKCIIRFFDESLYEESLNYFFFSSKLQYSSNFTIIKWVPMQGIITWIVMLIFLENKEKIKFYVYMALPLLLYGVFPFIGVAIFMFAYVIYIFFIEKNKKFILKEILSIENIMEIMTFGSVLFLYFYGNVFSEKPTEMNFRFAMVDRKILIFILFMVLPYAILLYKNNKKNVFYWISIWTLMILPFMWMGVFNDLLMRASISALFVLMILSLDVVNKYINECVSDKKIKIKCIPVVLIICIILGSMTPIKELIDSANTKSKIVRYDTMQIFANRKGDFAKMDRNTLVYNYYAYDIDDNIFYKYVARVKDNKYKKVKSGKVDTSKR